MELPALSIRVPQVDTDLISRMANDGINAFRQGEQDAVARNERNLLREVGGQAATGNYLAAAQTAMRGGELTTGLAINKYKAGVDAADTEKRIKLYDFFARGGDGADTPEKWQALISMAQGVYGQEADLSQFSDFNKRPQIVEFLRSSKSELERQKSEAEIGRINAQTDLYRAQASTGGAKAPPAGYRWSPISDGSLEAIPGGPATRLGAETSGRIAMMQTAAQGLKSARQTFLKPWGVSGTARNAASQVPYVGDVSWASGDVGRARRDVRLALEATLRAMTGAAAPESEVARYEAQFMPGVNDTQESATQKLDALEQFMRRAEEIVTRGRRDTPSIAIPGSLLRREKGTSGTTGADPLGLR